MAELEKTTLNRYTIQFKTATQMAEVTSIYTASDGVKLAAPTLRVIPVALVPVGRLRRRTYQASFALAAVFLLLVVPLVLGFSLSFHPNGVALQRALAQGASSEFVGQPSIGASHPLSQSVQKI